MGSEAPGESFSSPSVNPTVTAIKRGAGERTDIQLSDGSSFFVYPHETADLGLSEGMEVPPELREQLEGRQEYYLCREKAVELLARREHSSAELQRKLLQRDFSADMIQTVLSGLIQRGYLDDERFARIYAESRLRRKSIGAAKLAQELTRKGVSREVTERTVAQHCTDEYQRRAVEEAARKARRRVGDDREKLLRALLNRGFGMGYIRNCTIFQQINDKKEGI